MEHWQNKHYSFFQNTACEYFPCHETKHPERFNCLFCYCPLYALGRNCGGMIPHEKDNFGRITGRFQELCVRLKELEQTRE